MTGLYFRKGGAMHFENVQLAHQKNKWLEECYRALKAAIAEAHQLARNRDAPRVADKLQRMHLELRQVKREWVLVENRLAALIEQKTQVETYLENMRLKLVEVAKSPRQYLESPTKLEKLAHQMALLNSHLEQDNDLHEEIERYSSHCNAARNRVEKAVHKYEQRLREGFWRRDAAKIQGVQAQELNVVEWLTQHYEEVFGNVRTVSDLVNPVLREAMVLIERHHMDHNRARNGGRMSIVAVQIAGALP